MADRGRWLVSAALLLLVFGTEARLLILRRDAVDGDDAYDEAWRALHSFHPRSRFSWLGWYPKVAPEAALDSMLRHIQCNRLHEAVRDIQTASGLDEPAFQSQQESHQQLYSAVQLNDPHLSSIVLYPLEAHTADSSGTPASHSTASHSTDEAAFELDRVWAEAHETEQRDQEQQDDAEAAEQQDDVEAAARASHWSTIRSHIQQGLNSILDQQAGAYHAQQEQLETMLATLTDMSSVTAHLLRGAQAHAHRQAQVEAAQIPSTQSQTQTQTAPLSLVVQSSDDNGWLVDDEVDEDALWWVNQMTAAADKQRLSQQAKPNDKGVLHLDPEEEDYLLVRAGQDAAADDAERGTYLVVRPLSYAANAIDHLLSHVVDKVSAYVRASTSDTPVRSHLLSFNVQDNGHDELGYQPQSYDPEDIETTAMHEDVARIADWVDADRRDHPDVRGLFRGHVDTGDLEYDNVPLVLLSRWRDTEAGEDMGVEAATAMAADDAEPSLLAFWSPSELWRDRASAPMASLTASAPAAAQSYNEDEDWQIGMMLVCALLLAVAAMIVVFVRDLGSLRRVRRQDVVVPFLVENRDGGYNQGYMLLDEATLNATIDEIGGEGKEPASNVLYNKLDNVQYTKAVEKL